MNRQARIINLAPAVSTEVVRWCCKYWDVDLKESLHVPVFHVIALAFYWTSNSSRPLVVSDGKKLRGEDEIVTFFDHQQSDERKLVPEGTLGKEVLREVSFYRTTMRRAGVVRYMYWNLLKDWHLVRDSFTMGTPWFERLLARPLFPLIRFGLKVGLSLNESNARQGLDNIRQGFDRAEEVLADGRQYLAGDRFTMADLAFAASAAPALLIEGYAGNLPKVEALPKDMQTIVFELRSRPAGIFAQRIYSEHR